MIMNDQYSTGVESRMKMSDQYSVGVDKERLGSNLEALASLFKPNSPKQAHTEALASSVLDSSTLRIFILSNVSSSIVVYYRTLVVL